MILDTVRMVQKKIHRARLRNVNSSMEEEGEINVYTNRSNLKEHQLRKTWYIEYSGEGTPSDLHQGGFVVEYYGESKKLTMLFKDFQDFEQEINNRAGRKTDKTCWVCGKSPIYSISSLKAIESEVVLNPLGYPIMDLTGETGYVCQQCQDVLYQKVLNSGKLDTSKILSEHI